MNKVEKIEEIDRKCRMAGCGEKAAKRHAQAFVYEQWDVHPPEDFTAWCERRYEGWIPKVNPITVWNAARGRQEYLEAKEMGVV